MIPYDVVIVGAGHASTHAAIALRHNKFAGSMAMLGDEFELPYEERQGNHPGKSEKAR